MRRWTSLLVLMLVFSLLTACTDAGRYIKDTYPLISADGSGSSLSKVYAIEGKTIPVVAAELSSKEKPIEQSEPSEEQMFLLYNDKVINIQKDPTDNNRTLVQVDSIQYVEKHYDSSFLQTYLAISLLHSVFDDDWFATRKSTTYKGYSKTPTFSANNSKSMPADSFDKDKKPTTSEKTGAFSSRGKTSTKNNKSTSSSNIGSSKSGSSSTNRKNDGSTPNRVTTSTKSSKSKPSTSSKSGSFKRR